MSFYSIELTPDDNDTLLVTSPVLQGYVTYGDDRASALKYAGKAMLEWVASRLAHDDDIPAPQAFAHPDADVVEVPPLVALKITLQRAMKDRGVSRAELARRLGQHREQVDRLFRITHRSRLDQIAAALHVLGYAFEPTAWRIEDGAPAELRHAV